MTRADVLCALPLVLAAIVTAIVLIYLIGHAGPPTCSEGSRPVSVESNELVPLWVGKILVPTEMVVRRWTCVQERP